MAKKDSRSAAALEVVAELEDAIPLRKKAQQGSGATSARTRKAKRRARKPKKIILEACKAKPQQNASHNVFPLFHLEKAPAALTLNAPSLTGTHFHTD